MEEMLSVNMASAWLKARGIRPHSRAALYLAIARRELRVAFTGGKAAFIRPAELERYAETLTRRAE